VSRDSSIATYRHLTSPVVVSGAVATAELLRIFFISITIIFEPIENATKRD